MLYIVIEIFRKSIYLSTYTLTASYDILNISNWNACSWGINLTLTIALVFIYVVRGILRISWLYTCVRFDIFRSNINLYISGYVLYILYFQQTYELPQWFAIYRSNKIRRQSFDQSVTKFWTNYLSNIKGM